MNSKKLSFLWVWLLLPVFAIPSIGGRGLHLFLSGEGECLCHAHCRAAIAGPAGPVHSAAEEFSFPVQAAPVPSAHDEDSCFLCHFLAQPPAPAGPAPLFLTEEPVNTVSEQPILSFTAEPVLHSGRSPPCSFL